MESTLDIILMLVVLAVMDTLNAISPYLGFAILVVTLAYGIIKIYKMTLDIRITKRQLKESIGKNKKK
ncbi:MAG: hypothetical protein FVQ77_15465 [Cytophagales bacterium]|nr:hypothetical protein [Cytophagales bacterium]